MVATNYMTILLSIHYYRVKDGRLATVQNRKYCRVWRKMLNCREYVIRVTFGSFRSLDMFCWSIVVIAEEVIVVVGVAQRMRYMVWVFRYVELCVYSMNCRMYDK